LRRIFMHATAGPRQRGPGPADSASPAAASSVRSTGASSQLDRDAVSFAARPAPQSSSSGFEGGGEEACACVPATTELGAGRGVEHIAAKRALPRTARPPVYLRYYADLDYRSIAHALGVEVGTVSATLSSAHEALRRSMKEVER
jgi:DNA-directed RNA polymerase specialized sigma24 family protein